MGLQSVVCRRSSGPTTSSLSGAPRSTRGHPGARPFTPRVPSGPDRGRTDSMKRARPEKRPAQKRRTQSQETALAGAPSRGAAHCGRTRMRRRWDGRPPAGCLPIQFPRPTSGPRGPDRGRTTPGAPARCPALLRLLRPPTTGGEAVARNVPDRSQVKPTPCFSCAGQRRRTDDETHALAQRWSSKRRPDTLHFSPGSGSRPAGTSSAGTGSIAMQRRCTHQR